MMVDLAGSERGNMEKGKEIINLIRYKTS